MRSLVAACLSLLCITPAAADLDGHLLHRMCKQKNLEFVSGFVVGVTDKAAYDAEFVAALMAEKADLAKKTGPENREDARKAIRTVQPFCINQGAKLGEMTDLVCKALEMFPDIRKHKAAAITADVLKVKFPCTNERPFIDRDAKKAN
jgi:Rap1a immunity proteins